jgi:hypothetical protein
MFGMSSQWDQAGSIELSPIIRSHPRKACQESFLLGTPFSEPCLIGWQLIQLPPFRVQVVIMFALSSTAAKRYVLLITFVALRKFVEFHIHWRRFLLFTIFGAASVPRV